MKISKNILEGLVIVPVCIVAEIVLFFAFINNINSENKINYLLAMVMLGFLMIIYVFIFMFHKSELILEKNNIVLITTIRKNTIPFKDIVEIIIDPINIYIKYKKDGKNKQIIYKTTNGILRDNLKTTLENNAIKVTLLDEDIITHLKKEISKSKSK